MGLKLKSKLVIIIKIYYSQNVKLVIIIIKYNNQNAIMKNVYAAL